MAEILPGEVASPTNPPPGCRFHPRCKFASTESGSCDKTEPDLVERVVKDQYVACDLYPVLENEDTTSSQASQSSKLRGDKSI